MSIGFEVTGRFRVLHNCLYPPRLLQGGVREGKFPLKTLLKSVETHCKSFIVVLILESIALRYFENIPHLLLVLLHYDQNHFDLYNKLMFLLTECKEVFVKALKPITSCALFPSGFIFHSMR